MGYLLQFLEESVLFPEVISYHFLAVVKNAPFFSVGTVISGTTQKLFCAQVCVLDAARRRAVEELHNVCCKAVYPLLQIFLYGNKTVCAQVQPVVA